MSKYFLPKFDMRDYVDLLISLKIEGYIFKKIIEKDVTGKHIYLRHDIDYFLWPAETVAFIERELNIFSTFYILISTYDILSYKNRKLISDISNMGHEIGLHYDMSKYPSEDEKCVKQFKFECEIIEQITQKPVKTATCHLPHKKNTNIFDSITINPFSVNYLKDMAYISDSARAWRDKTILSCFMNDPPKQIVFNMHPETWLDSSVKNRISYLYQYILPEIKKESGELCKKWLDIFYKHDGGKLHDEREKK